MKKAPQNGGKGVPDLYLFLGAFYTAQHMKYALTPSKQEKTAAMARFWMGSFLRTHKLLKTNLKMPVAFDQPPAYTYIKKFLKNFNLVKESVAVLTNCRSILSLVQEREQVCPVRGLTQCEAQKVWRNVSHSALQNRHRDLAWMVAHEILPVRAVMHSRGMSKDPICPRTGCGAPETVRHALWECSAVRDLWATAGPQQFPYLPVGGVPDYPMGRGGVSQEDIRAKTTPKLWLTILCIKDAIWTSRNLLVGKRMQVPLHAIIQLAKSRLQGYTACRHSDVGVRASQEKVPTATSPDCPQMPPTP